MVMGQTVHCFAFGASFAAGWRELFWHPWIYWLQWNNWLIFLWASTVCYMKKRISWNLDLLLETSYSYASSDPCFQSHAGTAGTGHSDMFRATCHMIYLSAGGSSSSLAWWSSIGVERNYSLSQTFEVQILTYSSLMLLLLTFIILYSVLHYNQISCVHHQFAVSDQFKAHLILCDVVKH